MVYYVYDVLHFAVLVSFKMSAANAVSSLIFLILIRATHILNNRHHYGSIEGIMDIADHAKKGQIINTVTCMRECRRVWIGNWMY
jgi:hypothetical protein